MDELWSNRVLVACVLAWCLAQASKVFVYLLRERHFDLRFMTASGGMPSAHSASVVALATSTGIQEGLSSTAFALAILLAGVVMYDAAGVRRSVSIQARILNRLMTEVMETQHFNERRLRELIGHTPLEVFVGGLLGGLIAVSVT